MKQLGKKLLILLVALIIGGIYYYITIPAINIHSSGFWGFLLILMVAIIVVIGVKGKVQTVDEIKRYKPMLVGISTFVLLLAIYGIGSLLSSPIINARKYQQLLEVQDKTFEQDFPEVDFSQVPLLDKDSAELLGNRKMGSMVDMVSQFEVSNLYTQINFKEKPVRVTPLVYASPIKWLTNHRKGIPAYIKIDMTTQNTELVKLEEGMKYSQSEYFNRNIYRHLRFQYPTYIFDELSFEIDDNGTPYWICPVKKFNIGLFGGQTIGRVVLCNAITGESVDYDIKDCPTWVDRVYSAELLIQLYNYHGMLKNGFLNSILSQKGCLTTTEGYNYIAMNDDVWVYTGITSVSGDESNVGFVLMNQRTMETRYYSIAGAEEYSAMASAEGQVQNLKYKATFPLLLNLSNEPTYFMALKDDAGLVKKYAMVNVQKYQIVAIGDTVSDCEKEYKRLLKENGVTKEETKEVETITGEIKKIAQGVIEGNSHYYIVLDNSNDIFDVSVVDFLSIIKYEVGDRITLEYTKGETSNVVLGINK